MTSITADLQTDAIPGTDMEETAPVTTLAGLTGVRLRHGSSAHVIVVANQGARLLALDRDQPAFRVRRTPEGDRAVVDFTADDSATERALMSILRSIVDPAGAARAEVYRNSGLNFGSLDPFDRGIAEGQGLVWSGERNVRETRRAWLLNGKVRQYPACSFPYVTIEGCEVTTRGHDVEEGPSWQIFTKGQANYWQAYQAHDQGVGENFGSLALAVETLDSRLWDEVLPEPGDAATSGFNTASSWTHERRGLIRACIAEGSHSLLRHMLNIADDLPAGSVMMRRAAWPHSQTVWHRPVGDGGG